MTKHYLDRLARTINENWDSPALTDFYLTDDGAAQDTSRGNHYTYGELYQEILRLNELFKNLGLQKGDHIASCGANSAHWAIAYLAIAAYQGVAVTILHSQSLEDIAHQIDFSDAKALFTDSDLWEDLQNQSIPQVEHVIGLENWQILRGKESKIDNRKSIIDNREAHFECGDPDEMAMICFTSGSTSTSKGIMLSNRNMSNNAKNITDGYPDADVTAFLSVLPMAHIYGFMTEILAQLLKGKHVCVLGVVSISTLYDAIRIVRPYAFSFIPFLLSSLIKAHRDCISLLKDCKQIYIGGSLFDKDLEDELLNAKVPISIGYGQTETGPLISYSVSADYKAGTCGRIVEGMTARIAPTGEILVKGENVMLGYYKDPEATARKIDSDGWLHTGDKGHLDEDGYLYVEGRLEQDIIVLPNGENIRPDNIESLINALPEVSESIVLARNGHLVALVVPATPSSVSSASSVTSASSASSETSETSASSPSSSLRRKILRTVNPSLPLFSQLYDVEITDQPLARTEKQTLKRYLYS